MRVALLVLAGLCLGIALYFPAVRLFENKSLDDEMDALRALKQRSSGGGAEQAVVEGEREDAQAADRSSMETEAPRMLPLPGGAISETDPKDVLISGAPVSADPGKERGDDAGKAFAGRESREKQTGVREKDFAGKTAGTDRSMDSDAARGAEQSQNPFGMSGTSESPAVTGAADCPEPPRAPAPTPAPFVFDEEKILAEYKPLYAENQDAVGWLKIAGTPVDYPVLQRDDEEYYLTRDFYGRKNANGQLILSAECDPYTPSLNLVISGHNMKSGKMFGCLQNYASAGFARKNPVIEFDTLFRRGRYRVVTAFYTWDYQAREGGLRYNVDIRYRRQMTTFLEQLEPLKLYDTGVSVEFGDELLMLSTCSNQTDDGRFVVIARRERPGEDA